MMAFEITYRPYRPGDAPKILELYQSVFATPRTDAQWRWEYLDNPIGRHDIMLAFAGDRLISHTGGVPLVFRHDTRRVHATRLQHAVVHPDFYRWGAFTKALARENARMAPESRRRTVFGEGLARLTDDLARHGVDFVLAFPNDNSLPGLLRAGDYVHLVDVFPWVLPLAAAAPTPTDLTIEISDAASFTVADVGCAEQLLTPFAICNRRDLDYLNWRYHPASGRHFTLVRVWRGGTLAGWIVAKPFPPQRSIDLVECFLPPERSLVAGVLGSLADHFRSAPADRFSIWSMEHYPLHRSLVDLGFTADPRPTHAAIATLSGRCSSRSRETDAYYLSMGDSDVY